LTLPRIYNSFILVAPSITVAYIVGSLLGGALAINRGRILERSGIIVVMAAGTIPEFFIGIILITIFSSWLGLFPTGGMLSLEVAQRLGQNATFIQKLSTSDFWWHYTLPSVTIFIRYLMFPSLVMRSSMLDIDKQGFIKYNRITGLNKARQFKHKLKHSILPVITLFPASMTRSIGGLVLVEVVFNWPGVGNLLVESVLARDFPVIQFVFFLVAVWIIIGNYVVDLVYGVIDPRISIDN
jgi:peptide/nickel transport system permease protein